MTCLNYQVPHHTPWHGHSWCYAEVQTSCKHFRDIASVYHLEQMCNVVFGWVACNQPDHCIDVSVHPSVCPFSRKGTCAVRWEFFSKMMMVLAHFWCSAVHIIMMISFAQQIITTVLSGVQWLAHLIVSPVRSTYGGYYGLVVVTPRPHFIIYAITLKNLIGLLPYFICRLM